MPSSRRRASPSCSSEWHQLEIQRRPARDAAIGVTPYSLNSALFTDHAHKLRTVWVPDGSYRGHVRPRRDLRLPGRHRHHEDVLLPRSADGAAEVLLPESDDRRARLVLWTSPTLRLIETRVLVHRDDGWHAFPYVWDDDETEATLAPNRRRAWRSPPSTTTAPRRRSPTWSPTSTSARAATPPTTRPVAIEPIGPKARHLNGARRFRRRPRLTARALARNAVCSPSRSPRPRCPTCCGSGPTRPRRSKSELAPISTSTARTATARSAQQTPRGCSSTSTPSSGPRSGSARRRSLPVPASGGRLVDISPR